MFSFRAANDAGKQKTHHRSRRQWAVRFLRQTSTHCLPREQQTQQSQKQVKVAIHCRNM
jgi:hypothetical protein